MDSRKPFDLNAYTKAATTGPCFICALVAGEPAYAHHVVFEDAATIIFLSKYPTLRGYCLVCPKAHREDLATDLTEAEYLTLQRHVHRLARVLQRLFEAERIYVLSLGSRQANRHLHFHVAPLPPGVPLERQQYHALMAEQGVLELAEEDMAAMARDIAAAFAAEAVTRDRSRTSR